VQEDIGAYWRRMLSLGGGMRILLLVVG